MKKLILLALMVLLPLSVNAESKLDQILASGELKEKKGSTTQTLLNNIDVILINKGKNLVNLFVRRSFSEHLCSWINDSASRL